MKEFVRCPLKRCRAPMILGGFDALGDIIFVCPPCKRNAEGLCRSCPDRIGPRPARGGIRLYCERCRAKRVYDQAVARRADKYAQNARWRARPGVQARLNQLARERRKAHRPDDLDRAYQRAQRRRLFATDPTARERYNALSRETYRRNRSKPGWMERKRERSRQCWQRRKERLAAVTA